MNGEYLRFAPRSQAQRICSVMIPTSGYSEASVSTFDSHNLQEEIPVCNTITKSLSDVIDIM